MRRELEARNRMINKGGSMYKCSQAILPLFEDVCAFCRYESMQRQQALEVLNCYLGHKLSIDLV